MGTNAADSAESATSDRTVFGMRKAISNALIGPLMPKTAACAISRTRPMTREIPVATAKMTPERARPRPTSDASGRVPSGVVVGAKAAACAAWPS